MANPYKKIGTKVTPQSEPILGEAQVRNNAGGFVYQVDKWAQLQRFLILGTEGGTYYVKERPLTIDNAENVVACVKEDGVRAVGIIVEISQSGRAPKNTPALFALAVAASMGDVETKRTAFTVLPMVARIGTHLFEFLTFVQQFRGWGRGLRRAIPAWYTSKDADALAYQMLKYRQRGGWSQRDVLRKAHPSPPTSAHDALFNFVINDEGSDAVPNLVHAFVAAQNAADAKAVVDVITENPDLSWEMIPTEFLGEASVWEALLPNLPMTAMIRNLGRMSANGLLTQGSNAVAAVTAKLGDAEVLRKARVHPIAVLAALLTYSNGQGARGGLTWTPVPQVTDALDAAFYIAFGNVTPTGKRRMLALDVSGSMGGGVVAGVPGLTPRIASAAMALVTAAVEPTYAVGAFSTRFSFLDISPRQRLDDVVRKVSGLGFGGTDCAQPMLEALNRKLEFDSFEVYTDNETWAGRMHPSQALRQYRDKTGIPAKLVVVGTTATNFTIADPNDAGMLDVVGFDQNAPSLISDFVAQ